MADEIKNGFGASKGTIGYTPEDYKKALGGVNSYSTNTGDTTTDYYNALKNESYKALLNSEVQASIARDQAMKYTQNSLRTKGYGNQGISESSNLGLQSQYQTALANAANNYQTSLRTIDERQRNEQIQKENDNFESVTTLMQAAVESGGVEQLNNVLKTYGYGELDNNGNMDFTKLHNSSLDENNKKQIETLYHLYKASINETAAYSSLDSLNAGTYIGKDTKIHTFGAHYAEEMKYLWHLGENGQLSNGDTIQVNNGNGDTAYLQWVGNGFKVVNKPDKPTHTLTWTGNGVNYK